MFFIFISCKNCGTHPFLSFPTKNSAYGSCNVSTWYIRIPSDQISHSNPYLDPLIYSGAQYASVKPFDLRFLSPFTISLSPKSHMAGVRSCLSSTLWGLRSKWPMFLLWIYYSPWATPWTISSRFCMGSFSALFRYSFRFWLWQNSRIISLV